MYRLNIKNKYRDKVHHLKLNMKDINDLTIEYIFNNLSHKRFWFIIDSMSDIESIKKITYYSKSFDTIYALRDYLNSHCYFLLNNYNKELINYLNENKHLFAFNFPIDSAQKAKEAIDLGVCEIRIHGVLGFSEKYLRYLQETTDVEISVTPQICKLLPNDASGLKNFFIPPRAIHDYTKESPIGIVDFAEDDIKKEATLYKIYDIDGRWDGNLKELISGLNTDVDERYLLKDNLFNFYTLRNNCGQRCYIDGKCQACDNLAALSNLLPDLFPNY